MSKILIFHDTFLMKGGAERMNIEIAKILGADIATAVWSEDCYDPVSLDFGGKIIEVCPNFRRGMVGFLQMKWAFFRSRKLLSQYDTILFSNEAITGIWGVSKNTKTYYYAHSISRHLFDLRSEYLQKVSWYAKPIFLIANVLFKIIYSSELRKVGTVFVNSQMNKKRMNDWIGRADGIILSPSVDTEKFHIFTEDEVNPVLQEEGIHLQYHEYFISFARLTHIKRIDEIIRVFRNISDRKILILYGENDSQKEEFMRLGSGYDNIVFHKLSQNNHLPYIISGAIANICMSKNEDFGMVAIESQACGVGVIAVDEGGYQETVIHGETGILINPLYREQELQRILLKTPTDYWRSLSSASRKQAEQFSLEMMKKKIQEYFRE